MLIKKIKLSVSLLMVVMVALASHFAARTGQQGTIAAQELSQAAPASMSGDQVDALDQALQKRFHEVIGFGMARIAREKKFVPETEEEKDAVDSLKRAKLSVALYLAGRLVLEPKLNVSSRLDLSINRTVSRPIFINSNTAAGDLPQPLELWDDARKALAAFSEGKESYEFTVRDWTVRAHPVRASKQSCLECHKEDYRIVMLDGGAITFESKGNKLQLGDPLGVLLYAQRKRTDE